MSSSHCSRCSSEKARGSSREAGRGPDLGVRRGFSLGRSRPRGRRDERAFIYSGRAWCRFRNAFSGLQMPPGKPQPRACISGNV